MQKPDEILTEEQKYDPEAKAFKMVNFMAFQTSRNQLSN